MAEKTPEENKDHDEIIQQSEEKGYEELEKQSHDIKGQRAGTRLSPDYSANEDETTPSEDIETYRKLKSDQEETKHGESTP